MTMADEHSRLIRERSRRRARFVRQGVHAKKRLAESWRRPRGLHNKQRRLYKAKGAHPSPGFGAPAAIRGYHPSGFMDMLVHNPGELEGLDPQVHAVRIGGSVGNRKRALIQQKALEYGLKILNPKEIVSPELEEQEELEVPEDD
jgi:large subunit ribosomal protein L32e